MSMILEIEPQVSRVQFKQRIYTQNDSRREFEWHFRQIGRHIKFLKFSSAATRLQRRRPKSRPRRSTLPRPVCESSCWTSKEAHETSHSPDVGTPVIVANNGSIVSQRFAATTTVYSDSLFTAGYKPSSGSGN